MAIFVPAVAAGGMTNPQEHRSIYGEKKSWLTSLYRALADRAQALPSYLLHYPYIITSHFRKCIEGLVSGDDSTK